MSEIFCDNCGNKLSDDTEFCDNCGKNARAKNRAGYISSLITRGSNKIKKLSAKKLILSSFTICIIAGVFFVALRGYESQQQQIKGLELQQQATITQANAAAQVAQEATQQAQQQAAQQAQNTQNELQQLQQTESQTSTPDLSAIVATWRPIIAHVACEYDDGTISLGSSTLIIPSDGSEEYVLTNRHVITDADGNISPSCVVKFPLDDTIFDANDPNSSGGSDITIASDGSDTAHVYIDNPDSYIAGMTTDGRHECTATPAVGDSIVIIGYPSIGSQTDITATQGIISGYDGDYYITSAGIDHGNSGGAAIDEKNNCYLGIPTWAESGSFESLGRILKWQAF